MDSERRPVFRDRTEAGRRLAEHLSHLAGRDDVVVLGLPRGGVAVAHEVARSLRTPLDIIMVRKLGVPGQEELAMGAIASGGATVLNETVINYLGIPEEVIEQVARAEEQELERRENVYRGGKPLPDLRGRVVILVDDGLATGATMMSGINAVKQLGADKVVVAVPVAPASTREELKDKVSEVVCLFTPEQFDGVGRWYVDFSQLTDDDVRGLLREGSRSEATS